MSNIATLKNDLRFNSELSSIIEALKAISVTQFQIWQERLVVFSEFHRVIEDFLSIIDPSSVSHPFIDSSDKGFLVVGITSDSGLLGALNYQVINACLKEIKENSGQLVVVGERGKVYLKGLDISFISFPGVKEEIRYSQAQSLKGMLVKNILARKAGGLIIVYPKALSMTIQRIEIMRIFPYRRDPGTQVEREAQSQMIKESSFEDIITYLGDLLVGQVLYEAMGMSKLAEYAARVVHLEESAQKLKDIDKKTKLKYFKAKHELVDKSMRELFAARNIFK